MRQIEVKTGRSYQITVGEGLLDSAGAELRAIYPAGTRLAVVTDDRVDALYGDRLVNGLQASGFVVCKFVFAHGEVFKTLKTVSLVYEFLAENGITRTDAIVALGGGVTGDLAGFAAASWLRGIDFVQLPTTLLAMVDSSVGGKTGVDIPQGKNMVGAFWQPARVLCDLALLRTLTSAQLADGAAEIIKYGAILDEELFGWMETDGLETRLEEIVCRCIEWKRQVVERDERDKGERQWLNFGHTLGHALEQESGFEISHGQGVALGMVMITAACERQGLTPGGTAARLTACCEKNHLPTTHNFTPAALCHHCAADKKRAGGLLTLVTLERLGKAALTPISADRLEDFLKGAAYD